MLVGLLYSPMAFSQDEIVAVVEEEGEGKTFTLSGSIDTYLHSTFGTRNIYPYDYDFDEPGGAYAPNSSFANNKGFALGMVNLIASYSGEKSGFVADLVFGPRGQDAVFATASGQAIINQLYAYYKLSDGVTLNMGQFNTFLGYEVISPTVNFNYSTSYLFSYGPFNHTGLRADFDFGGGFVGKAAIMNPTDIVEFNPINTYTLGAQFGYTNDAGGIWFNFLYGDQDGKLKDDLDPVGSFSGGNLFQWDITTGWNLGENFYLGANISQQTVGEGQVLTADGVEGTDSDPTSFFGVALYPKLTISDAFSIGLRAEQFMVKKGHLEIFGLDDEGNGSVTAITLSANINLGGLVVIPEIRVDKTSEDSFFKYTENGTDADLSDMMTSVNLAAVYKF